MTALGILVTSNAKIKCPDNVVYRDEFSEQIIGLALRLGGIMLHQTLFPASLGRISNEKKQAQPSQLNFSADFQSTAAFLSSRWQQSTYR